MLFQREIDTKCRLTFWKMIFGDASIDGTFWKMIIGDASSLWLGGCMET